MKREIIRVEPLATYLEGYKAPTSTVSKHGDTIYVSGMPPFDPKTGKAFLGPIERQTELVLEQLKLCVETAGSSLLISKSIALRQSDEKSFEVKKERRDMFSVIFEVHPRPEQWDAYLGNA